MIWHAFPLRRAHSAEYFELDDAIVGRHQRLLWACASANDGRGNSGVWRDSAGWDTRKWLRFAGLERDQVEELVTNNLARWVTRETADQLISDLSPTEAQTHEEGFDWERCRVTAEALDQLERRSLSIRSTHLVDRDRHTLSIEIDADLSRIDLVVFDFDLGGQVKSQLVSEQNRKNATLRWNAAKQLELPSPTDTRDAACRSRSGRDRHTAQNALAMHSNSDSTQRSPPNPPPGGRSPRVQPSPADAAQLESLWAWVLANRPAQLNSALWGGAKAAVLRTMFAKSIEAWIPLPELLATLKADLSRKFRDPKWVHDWALSQRGLRAYVRDDDWQTPLPAEKRRPELVIVASGDKHAVAVRNLLELLADPDVPEVRKGQARAKWLADNPAERPPWEPEIAVDTPAEGP